LAVQEPVFKNFLIMPIPVKGLDAAETLQIWRRYGLMLIIELNEDKSDLKLNMGERETQQQPRH
jgi:hypothetical protein